MMISEHYNFLKFVFLHFARLMLHLMTDRSLKQESNSYMLTDALLDPEFISFGFSTSATCSISVEAELPLSS